MSLSALPPADCADAPTAVARVQNEFCKLPQRSRKIDETIIAPLGAIAMLCILLRLLSRFLVKIPYQADDYIMMVVAVRPPLLQAPIWRSGAAVADVAANSPSTSCSSSWDNMVGSLDPPKRWSC